jgi:hypothetical protein
MKTNKSERENFVEKFINKLYTAYLKVAWNTKIAKEYGIGLLGTNTLMIS